MMLHQIELGSFTHGLKFRKDLLPVMNAAITSAVCTQDPYCCKMAVAGLLPQCISTYLADTSNPSVSASESFYSFLMDYEVPKPSVGGVSSRTAFHAAVNATDAAIKYAQENGIDLSTVTGTGTGGKITLGDVQRA